MLITGMENLAAMFGVAPKTIVEWQEQGLPIHKRGKPGVPSQYQADECIAWYVARELGKVQGESPRDRLARLQAEEIELRLAEKRGQLVPATLIEPMWTAMVASARGYLRGQSDDLAELMEETPGIEAKRDLLSETFDEFLSRLSTYDPSGHAKPDAERGAAAPAADEEGDEEDGPATEDLGS